VNETPLNEPAQRPPRYQIGEQHAARVRLKRCDSADSTEFDAELIDISRGGTKLRVATCLKFEESVGLKIEIPSVDLNCYVLATVRHIREAGAGRWVIGCSVDPPLEERAIARIVTQAAVDRRRWPRYPISLAVSVRRQLDLVDNAAVMTNLSQGGFCVRLSAPCEADERIRVVVAGSAQGNTVIEARAQWQMETTQGFLAGCAFLRPDDYHIVRAAASSVAAGVASRAPRPVRRPLVRMSVASACGACAVILAAANDLFVGAPADSLRASAEPQQAVAAAATSPALSAMLEASPASAAEPAWREWTDDSGQFRVMAVLLSVGEDHVYLHRQDGKEVRVPLNRLSQADVEFALAESQARNSTMERIRTGTDIRDHSGK
jgi:hypothetical protein